MLNFLVVLNRKRVKINVVLIEKELKSMIGVVSGAKKMESGRKAGRDVCGPVSFNPV